MSSKLRFPGAGTPKVGSKKKGNQPKVWIGAIFQDGGGVVISVDVFGRPVLKRIPPWQPDVARLAIVGNLLSAADRVRDRATRKQLNTLAEQIATEALPGLQAL